MRTYAKPGKVHAEQLLMEVQQVDPSVTTMTCNAWPDGTGWTIKIASVQDLGAVVAAHQPMRTMEEDRTHQLSQDQAAVRAALAKDRPDLSDLVAVVRILARRVMGA